MSKFKLGDLIQHLSTSQEIYVVLTFEQPNKMWLAPWDPDTKRIVGHAVYCDPKMASLVDGTNR